MSEYKKILDAIEYQRAEWEKFSRAVIDRLENIESLLGYKEAERATESKQAPQPRTAEPATPAPQATIKELKWQTAEGQKGPYEYVPREADQSLFDRIDKTEKGTMFEDGYFYWLRNTDGAVCRKKTQSRARR